MRVRFLADPHAHRGRLLAGGVKGEAVRAGSQMRGRTMVLDAGLLKHPAELARIVVHETMHFVWLRAGNSVRRSYEATLAAEMERGARGELGWSAELRKRALSPRDAAARTRGWREYVCESFCDTGAWVATGARRHGEATLAPRWRERRRKWFSGLFTKPLAY